MEKAKEKITANQEKLKNEKKELKVAENKAYNEGIKNVQMANKDFEKNNPDFKKNYQDLFKKGPVNAFYKILASKIKDVVTIIKMFFFKIYTLSLQSFLPFIMSMSFGFSFIKYLFQKVKNM